jgi:hypothetical protein
MVPFDTCYSSLSFHYTGKQQEGKLAHGSGHNINAKDDRFHSIEDV